MLDLDVDHTDLRLGGAVSGAFMMLSSETVMYSSILIKMSTVVSIVTTNLNINFL